MSNPQTPPAGWYADPSGQPLNRWWDGTSWAENVQQPYQSAGVALRAPDGTSPSTVQIWLIVALFALQLLGSVVYLTTFDFAGYMQSTIDSAGSADPNSALAMYGYIFTPGYLLLLALSFIGYVGPIVLAFFDTKELERRGVAKPFPWALSFIPSYGSAVYVIGRSVVARRRTGSGMAPMWAYIAIFVIGGIAGVVLAIAMFSSVMSSFSGITG